MFDIRRPLPLIFGYIALSSSHAYSTIRHHAIMLLSSTPSLSSENIQPILNIHSPVKRNHSLLDYTRDLDTQMIKLGPFGPFCIVCLSVICSIVLLTIPRKYFHCGSFCYMFCRVPFINVFSLNMYV